MAKLWGSRFEGNSDVLADQLTFSIGYDYRLGPYDVQGSIAHAQMLARQGIISKAEGAALVRGLEKILAKMKSGAFKVNPKAEDIHTQVQDELKALIGAPADKLHTARSRNDQVVLDVTLYCLDQARVMVDAIKNLQKAIVSFASKNQDVIMPGYTHLQGAQVVLLAHHMLAYVHMLERDKGRLQDFIKRYDALPLGACALSGTSLRTDRAYVAKLLGFSRVMGNSMDTVASRDIVAELLSDCAMLAVHLSRISEDLILWATREFDFIDIDWSMCTGSSIMPHKKNPDVLELIRGQSARMIANANNILVLTKGLPLTYNRDMQLDKPPLFESVESSVLALKVLAKLFDGLNVKKANIAKRTVDESFFCVDAMDYLIKKGVSYRAAHDILGRMVKDCLDRGRNISSLTEGELKKYAPQFGSDVKNLFNPQMSVKIKTSFGSTNPRLVAKELKTWALKLKTK